nr:hypothetical protein [Verrucosispora sioxanthis]
MTGPLPGARRSRSRVRGTAGPADGVRAEQRIADALADARDMPDGELRVGELERVAALAEADGDRHTALDAWCELVETHLRGGERWRLFEPVQRCLRAAETDDDTLRRATGGTPSRRCSAPLASAWTRRTACWTGSSARGRDEHGAGGAAAVPDRRPRG